MATATPRRAAATAAAPKGRSKIDKRARSAIAREIEADMAELAAALRQQIEAAADGWEIGADAIARRRLQVLDPVRGFAFFHATYFPHYGRAEPSVLHTFLHQRLPAIVQSPDGQRDAVAAPRGEAKSTVVSLVFVLWCIVTERKHYLILIMDAFEQAAEMLEAVKAELEANTRLASDFPGACGKTRVWRVGTIITANGRKVEAFGSAKKIRGRRHGPHRPDLAILDDIENDENVATPEQRDKLQRFVTASVLSLGPADDSMDCILIGTVLHYDSVLARFLKNPMWNRKVFKAIQQWPDRMDLWDTFEELLLTAEAPDKGLAAAQAFYSANRAAMDAGARVSWPAVRPLVKLMIKRARDGHAAFDSEQQNDPLHGDDAPFANAITFWVNKLSDWVMYGACDPSLGLKGKGRDPSALLVGGWHRERGVLDVVEALIRKRTPDRIISDVIDLQREYCCLQWAVETVQFQEFLRQQLLVRSVQAGVPVSARPFQRQHDKHLDIETLQPHMVHGQIRLHPSQTTLVEQLRHFPKADHDDGPDALYMLWRLAATGGMAAGVTVQADADPAADRRKADRTARRAQRRMRALS